MEIGLRWYQNEANIERIYDFTHHLTVDLEKMIESAPL